MFESTLEAQGLHQGDRRLGTVGAAVLAHVGLGVAIVVATTLLVPPPHVPEPTIRGFVITTVIPMGDKTPEPARPPAPKKGADVATPGKAIVPPRADPELPPTSTPDTPPPVSDDENDLGSAGPGEGAQGEPGGSEHGVTGGTGAADRDGGGDTGLHPLEVNGDMVRPSLIQRVEPAYPDVARKARLGGRVTLRAVIAPDGSVESVEVFASTNPLFNEAAVSAVRKWRYRPALMNGRPVRVYFSVVVDFVVR